MTTNLTTPPSEPAPRKKSGFRILKWIVLAIVILVVIVVSVVFMKLDEIVRRTVETQAAASLNVPTMLQGASISLLGGSVKLSGFDLGSPTGFKSPQMMSLGEIGRERQNQRVA